MGVLGQLWRFPADFLKYESQNIWATLMGNIGGAQATMVGQPWNGLGNYGSSWVTMAISSGFLEIRASNFLGNSDGQQWRSSGNYGWATMKRLGATLGVLRQHWRFPGIFRNSSLKVFGQYWWATMAEFRQLWMGNHETAWATMEVLRQHWRFPSLHWVRFRIINHG